MYKINNFILGTFYKCNNVIGQILIQFTLLLRIYKRLKYKINKTNYI